MIGLCNLASINLGRLDQQIADIYLDGSFPAEHEAVATSHVNPQPFVGIYRSAADHSVVEVRAIRERPATAQRMLFRQIAPNRFAAKDGGRQISFEPAKDGGIRMTVSLPSSTALQVFERFQPVKPAPEDLAQYVGEYVSDELQTDYRFAVKDGKLTVANNKWQEAAVLQPSVRDEFRRPRGIVIVFHRDATGRITDCDVFAGRVRNIAFARK